MADSPLQVIAPIIQQTDRELSRLYSRAAVDAEKTIARLLASPGVGNKVRAAQLRLVIVTLKEQQRQLWNRTSRVIDRGVERAVEAAETAVAGLETGMMRNLSARDRRELVASLRAQAQATVRTERARVARALSPRVFKNRALATGQIEDLIRLSVLQGRSAREIALNARRFIHPGTPGGSSYAAMRLGRTELANAFHSAEIDRLQNRPWVNRVKWNLSGSHKTPDKCNALAKSSYPVNDVPGKPHPQCLCYVTPVLPSRQEFIAGYLRGDYQVQSAA